MKKRFAAVLFFLLLVTGLSCYSMESTEGTWTKKADFPSSSRNYGLGFSINNKGYYGMGQKQIKPFIYKVYTDIWEYDPQANTWTQKSDFPAPGRLMTRGFTINNKIYAGLGYIITPYGANAGANQYQTDLYEFDPATNQWSQKNESLLGRGDIFFSMRDNVFAVNPEYRTVNKYNATTDTWLELNWEKSDTAPDYESIAGSDVCFAAKEKIYMIATTRKKDSITNQLWEFEPNRIKWKQKNNLPQPGNDTVSVLQIGEKAFAILGRNTILEYHPGSDSWTEKGKMPAANKDFYSTFSIAGKDYGFSRYQFWEFVP